MLLSLPKPEASQTVVAELVACARPPGLIVETSTITPKPIFYSWPPILAF